MHPFSLSKEQIEEVSGGTQVSHVASEGGEECSILNYETGLEPTVKLKEDGGELTTMAIGEEGGLPVQEI